MTEKKNTKYTWDEWVKKIADRDGHFLVLIHRDGDDITMSGQGFLHINAETKKELIDSIKALVSKRKKRAKK